MDGSFEHEVLWYPLAPFGITHPYTALVAGTVINTWITLALLVVLICVARYFLSKKDSYAAFLVKSVVKSFMQLIEQSASTFIYRYYTFIASLFIFIILCNWIALIPYVEEPTKDLNTTLALGIIAFIYIQKEIIKVHGFGAYLKEYFMPFNIIFPLNLMAGILLLPIKLLSEVASVISLSFRLFGNIFGGAIIISIVRQGVSNSIVWHTVGTFLGVNLLLAGFFVLFEGFLQAFVFSILTLTNVTMAAAMEQGEH